MILVVAEQREGVINPVTWETVTAAQLMAAKCFGPVKVVVIGAAVTAVADEIAWANVAEVLVVDSPVLEPYTSDGFVGALTQVVDAETPDIVLFTHTYQTRDYAPMLATRCERTLVTDCIGLKPGRDGVLFVRPMFQGKFVADIAVQGPAPYFVSCQVGVYRADAAVLGATRAPTRCVDLTLDAAGIRQRPEAPFKETKQAVDLTQAERIVAVGRGIKGQEYLPVVQELAKALDAEVAASRPICDVGWLPMDRQVGSSGQTVAPKLYLAVGISGAIQHLVGMKGARTIVAVNKDADAPIFEVADYGIVGDLFDVVPAVTAALGD
jgi:electron transfer flavoprotein alpha subunit